MGIVKFLLLVALSMGAALYGHNAYLKHEAYLSFKSSLPKNTPPGQVTGFVSLPIENTHPDTIIIASAPDCPREAAQYARSLKKSLETRGIPVQMVNSLKFKFDSQATADKIQGYMQSAPQPPVVINGKIKGHPSLDDVLAEAAAQNIFH